MSQHFSKTPVVTLRKPEPADVPLLFAFESDPAWRSMAMVKPRSREAFEAVWCRIFQGWADGDTQFVQKTILADDEVCGTIGVRPDGDRFMVGYGLSSAWWGRGIASQALAQLLAQVQHRPLFALVAVSNAASIRVLEKQGFVIVERIDGPETERYLPCEELVLILE